MWKTHNEPTCKDHGFDFIQAFEKNADVIRNLSPLDIFGAIKLTPPANLIKKAKKEFFGDYPELEFTVLKRMTEKHLNE